MGTWRRTWEAQMSWATGNMLITHVPAGKTLLRVHFGFRFGGVSSTLQSQAALAEDFMAIGVVTQLSTHGSTPPNALTAQNDAASPTERWIWWATASMHARTFGAQFSDSTNWSTSEVFENVSTKGQVLANTVSPNTLDVYLSWAPWVTSAWAARGQVFGSAWASALYTT